jgi:hypothetical protein
MSGYQSKRDAAADKLQEPVAWIWKDMRGQDIVSLFEPRLNSIPLYAAPPQRKPLTDADYVNACISYRHDFGLMTQEQRDKLIFQAREWARAFGINEVAHGIKENT